MLYLGACWETATLEDKKKRKTVIPIPSDRENVAQHNYNWVSLPLSEVKKNRSRIFCGTITL